MNSVHGVLNRHCRHEGHSGQDGRPCVSVLKRSQANRKAGAPPRKIETDETCDNNNDAEHRQCEQFGDDT